MADPEVQGWLQALAVSEENFNWDKGNSTKILIKHRISRKQIESILLREYVFVGKIVEPFHEEWRGLILGISVDTQLLALIFTRRNAKLRPISCRPMRKEEVKIYYENI